MKPKKPETPGSTFQTGQNGVAVLAQRVASSTAKPLPIAWPSSFSACLRELGGLGSDDRHQLVPGVDERLGSLLLRLGAQAIDADARRGKLGQHLLAITTVR